ncbi:hypothetical protein ACGTJS_08650 [Faucicola mancuniensis]|uniref:hypothetical protein n=1 Tax=Faucicola mancuniensis TaxID=1309795 RepID=UPI0028E599E4|nr:hypothetical protein [uncultured Moraxella sp.]
MLKPIYQVASIFAISLSAMNISHAEITNSDIQRFASQMNQAANSKSISTVNRLVSDDALISISRRGRTSTLDKANYLNLLQTNWARATQYHYNIQINNMISTGKQAKADIITVETITEDKRTLKLITTSRATFSETPNGVVLTRAISNLTIE